MKARAFKIFLLKSFSTGVFFISANAISYGQSDIFPVYYTQYFLNPGIINPAVSQPRGNFEGLINSRKQIGPFNNVGSSLAQATFVLKKNEEGASHMTGLILQNESEGKFLDRTRVYGLYIVKTKISSTISLNAGIALGTFGYSVHSSNSNAGGGAMTIDGKLGTYLYTDKWSVGLSTNQIFNNKLTPFDATLRLKRFYTLFGNYKINLNQSDLNFYYQVDYTSNYFKASVNAIVGLIDKIEFGAGYRYMEGATLYGGLRKIEIQKKYLRIGLSYFVPMHNRLASNRIAEFTLRLY